MAQKRKLLSQQLIPFGIVLILSFLALSYFSSKTVSRFYYDETVHQLQYHLKTVKAALTPMLKSGDSYKIDNFCKSLFKDKLIRLTVILSDGKVIGDSRKDPDKMENHHLRPEVISALNKKGGTALRYSTTLNTEMLYVAEPVFNNKKLVAVVRLAIPNEFLKSTLTTIYGQFILFGIIAFILLFSITFLIFIRLNRATNDLIDGAAYFAKGDLHHTIDISSNSYLKPLANTMNLMANQLEHKMVELDTGRLELNTILGSMSESIVAVDNEGRILRTNKMFNRLFELDETQIQGKVVFELVLCPDLHDFIRDIMGGKKRLLKEIVYNSNNKKHYLTLSGGHLLLSEEENWGCVVVITDITRVKRLEQIRKDFVANVSHELKTPITVIKGSGETVETTLEQSISEGRSGISPTILRFTNKIMFQVERMENIVEDLLSLSRLEDGEIDKFSMNVQKLVSLINQSIVSLEEKAVHKNIKIEVNIDPQCKIRGNGVLLIQAFTNIIENGIKYSGENSSIKIVASLISDKIEIIFKDEGDGIAPNHIPRIFERFYRVDKGRSKSTGGTGLGLSIVKHIVNIHDGTIRVESKLQHGTTFILSFPAILLPKND